MCVTTHSPTHHSVRDNGEVGRVLQAHIKRSLITKATAVPSSVVRVLSSALLQTAPQEVRESRVSVRRKWPKNACGCPHRDHALKTNFPLLVPVAAGAGGGSRTHTTAGGLRAKGFCVKTVAVLRHLDDVAVLRLTAQIRSPWHEQQESSSSRLISRVWPPPSPCTGCCKPASLQLCTQGTSAPRQPSNCSRVLQVAQRARCVQERSRRKKGTRSATARAQA